jgi:hypothetical protein
VNFFVPGTNKLTENTFVNFFVPGLPTLAPPLQTPEIRFLF